MVRHALILAFKALISRPTILIMPIYSQKLAFKALIFQGCSEFYFKHTHSCAVWALRQLTRVSGGRSNDEPFWNPWHHSTVT